MVSKKEEIKYNDIIKKKSKIKNFENLTKENTKEHNPNWP